MRQFLFFFFLIISGVAPAQMDTEHWFPAMFNNSGDVVRATLYLSTNQTTPFTVTVYSAGNAITTTTIAKGSPAALNIDADYLFTSNTSEILTPISKGIRVSGNQKFFANLRFSVYNHAEFVTSKGTAGLGKLFYAAPTPLAITEDDFDFTVGVIATEDNTTVTASGYKSGVTFFDGTAPPTLSVKLNRGESYLMSGTGLISANQDGFIGAKITADKAIAMVNGNMNGNIVSGGYGRDIYMDESVPVDHLGSDFIIIKGNGNIGDNMERPLIVATADNTRVFVNGAATAYPFIDIFGNIKSVLNAGDYGLINDTDYINQGGLYNMSVKANNPIYVYQNLAGTNDPDKTFATGGYNFIPALSCFLPNKIDEIADINQIGGSIFNTKINIITEHGGTITYTGGGTLSGPYPVTGNSAWDTYNVLNASGNISVTSTKSLTAGIAAGSNAIGYGGYFAGFNSVPVISKNGDCTGTVTLQVDNSYDSYQWYLNGIAISGADDYRYTPNASGNYTVAINKNGCGNVTTPAYAYTVCPLATAASYAMGACAPFVIKPKFTQSAQHIVPGKTVINAAPANGTATVDPATGFITYTLANPPAASDSFSYTITGDDPGFPDSETVTVNLAIHYLTVYDGISQACVNGTGLFYINQVKLTDDAAATARYFSTETAAQARDTTQEITTFPYKSAAGTVYARVTDEFGCAKIAKITLQDIQPAISVSNYNAQNCDDDLDGIITVDFSQITPLIIRNYQTATVEYSLSSDFSTLLPNSWSYTANTRVYVRAYAAGGCVTVMDAINFTFGEKVPDNAATETVCDDDLDGIKTVDISSFKAALTPDINATLTYFTTEKDAALNTNALANTQIAINQNATFYARLTDSPYCPAIAPLAVNIRTAKSSAMLTDAVICPGTTINLDAGTGFDSYLWSTGSAAQKSGAVGPGNYWVDLGFNGCVYHQKVSVKAAESPVINAVAITENNISVSVSGGTPPYLYALDGGPYQPENTFTGLSRGKHTIFVKDANSCAPVSRDFSVIRLINAITPNEDGYNDALDYSDLSLKNNVIFQVYDRYGKLVYDAAGKTYKWDGKTGDGRAVPTAAYWYILSWEEPDTRVPVTFKGWVLVKNR